MVESENLFYSICFKPLDVWMRCLGIQLNPYPSANSSKCKSICLYSVGLLVFFINVSSNIYFTIVSFSSPSKSTQKSFTASTSDIWSRIIDFGSHNLMAIGTHAALLALTRQPEWKLLWHNLQQLAAEHGQLFYSKSRRVVKIVLLCLTADVSAAIVRATVLVVNSDGPLLLVMADAISVLSEIYATSGLALFVTIGWITSIQFELLYNQLNLATGSIGQRNNPSSRITTINTSTDLKRWRRTYVKLTETVVHIGQCFGPLILIWIAYIFISVIAISFYIVDGVHREFVMSTVSFMFFILLRHLVHLLVLATIPVIFKQKSHNISKPLRTMRFDEPILQRQLDTMVMEVMQSPTTMTAMGLFPVNLTLIPTLIGTSLTYLIILCQFQIGESQNKQLCDQVST